MMNRKIILQFIGALSLSIIAGILFYVIGFLMMVLELGINLGGDKMPVLLVLFLGIPLGSLLGILLVDRMAFGYEGYNLVGLGIGFVLCLLVGGIGSVMLLDQMGQSAVLIVPLLIVCLSFVGYYLPSLWRRTR